MEPDPGDLTVCTACGGVNVFDAELRLHAVSEADVIKLGRSGDLDVEQLRRMQAVVKSGRFAKFEAS